MGKSRGGINLVQVDGHHALLIECLRDPLRRALGHRRTYYAVGVESVGGVGDVVLSIPGSQARLGLCSRGVEEKLERVYVLRAVSDIVSRSGF